jgi:hypothetical protein
MAVLMKALPMLASTVPAIMLPMPSPPRSVVPGRPTSARVAVHPAQRILRHAARPDLGSVGLA